MEKFIQVDGLKIRYLENGNGAPVLLLHGASLGSSADVWEETLNALATGGFQGIAYDQPGYGHSDNPTDYRPSYRESFVIKFLDALKISKATLVGHSQAGGFVIGLALKHPDRLIKAVTVGTGSLLPRLADQAAGGPAEGEEGTKESPTLDDTRKLLEGNLFHKDLITPEVLQKRHEMSLGKNFAASLKRLKAREPRKSGEVPLSQRLTEVTVPLLMLYGAQDRGSAAKRATLLKQQEPKLRIEIVEEAAHLLMWDARKVFFAKMLDFLSA
ncbi:MAG: alpha/beta fold hydrolase [Deltaproteobacteria bacterium]|nr:alpha/beta fold hydrolase [Deltaproteobacteria bacterium]